MLHPRKYCGVIYQRDNVAPSVNKRTLGGRPLPSTFGEPGGLPRGSMDVSEAAQLGGSHGQTFLQARLADLLPSAEDVAFISSAPRPCTR